MKAQQMTPEAIEARRKYNREWARKNREKVRGYAVTHWERVAAQEAAQSDKKKA